MVIIVSEIVDSCDTNQQGEVLKNLLSDRLLSSKITTLDFTGVLFVTSSFVNTAFADLLSEFSFDNIKKYVKFSGTNRQISGLIRDRMVKTNNANTKMVAV
ncbi:hypothetical protein MNBD_ALPHA03-1816 [hydrothermal vent metagenome]|uniref:DUF4325 domain-containing protein n=1 Tax=hydrothermal vent metagenome TaxID=652676 RepID=A0A3B1AFG6_9ZZZZ